MYQSFWTLTGNPKLMGGGVVRETAEKLGVSGAGALYSLVLGLGGTVICNGTTSVQHMKEDWEAVKKAREFAARDEKKWKELVVGFRRAIGEKAS